VRPPGLPAKIIPSEEREFCDDFKLLFATAILALDVQPKPFHSSVLGHDALLLPPAFIAEFEVPKAVAYFLAILRATLDDQVVPLYCSTVATTVGV
jgi:hypothetical protein